MLHFSYHSHYGTSSFRRSIFTIAMPPPSAQSVNAAKEKLLKALSEFRSIGQNRPQLKAVGQWAGYVNVDSKHVRHALGQLKEQEFIVRGNGCIQLTEKGIEAAPAVEDTPNDVALQEKILQMILAEPKGLPSAENTTTVFHQLLDGKAHPKSDLVRTAGYTHVDSHAFRNLLKRMESLGMLDKSTKKGHVQLSDMAFAVGGRPSGKNDAGASLSKKGTSTCTPSSAGKRKSLAINGSARTDNSAGTTGDKRRKDGANKNSPACKDPKTRKVLWPSESP
jgi:hypothetical protein